jgi:transposase
MKKKHNVSLSRQQRRRLEALVSAAAASARKMARARILLEADGGSGGIARNDLQISRELAVGTATVYRVRRQFCEEGLEAALSRKPTRRTYQRKIDADTEAQLVELVKTHVPPGRQRWTLRLLANHVAAISSGCHVSHETVRQVLLRSNVRLSGAEEAAAASGGA